MNPEFLNIEQVAEYLGVKPGTVYSWAEARKIPSYKFGRLIRFKKDEIESWAAEQRQDCAPLGRALPKYLGKAHKNLNVGEIIRKSIDNVKQERYNIPSGKIGPYRGLHRKGGKNGAL